MDIIISIANDAEDIIKTRSFNFMNLIEEIMISFFIKEFANFE